MKTIKNTLPLIALIIGGIIIAKLITPDSLEKYVGELINETNHLLADGQMITYVDYNNDSLSEQFIYYHMSDNRQPVINQYSHNGDFQSVWYLDGEVVENFDFVAGDYDQNNKKEIYLFSIDKNKLLLYGLIPSASNRFLFERVIVHEFDNQVNTKHFIIRSGGIHDLNNDGYGELVFSVNSRFSNSPRKIYTYDIKNKKINASAELGMQLVGSPIVYDIDHDKKPEIFIATLNSTNQAWVGATDKGLYSASIVLNANLSYRFVPILYESRMSVTSTFPYNTNNSAHIASLSWSLNEKDRPRLILLNKKGEVKKIEKLKNNNYVFDPNRKKWDQLLLFTKSGSVENYNNNLDLQNNTPLKGPVNQISFIDIDKDGIEEFITVHNNILTIYRYDYSNPVKIEIPGLGIQKVWFSIKQNGTEANYLSAQNKNYQYLISYSQNKKYWLKYVLYAGCIIVLLVGYFIILKFYQHRVKKAKYSNEKFFAMQLDLIKSQLDPHFLFNALNSIAFSINKEDRKTAYSNLGLFSKFMRESIVSMDEFSRSLDEEIGYVKNYLTLEKFRFKEQFSFDFIISPDVKRSSIIPKLVIFSFTESALKKGVLPKEGGGRIEFTIDAIDNKSLFISISDNGLHRNLEKSTEEHTINMLLMNRIVAYFNRFNTSKIEINVYDNGSDEKPRGSRVEITIPLDYNYII